MSFFFFKQKTAYEMRISDWSSDVCSSDLRRLQQGPGQLLAALVVTAVCHHEAGVDELVERGAHLGDDMDALAVELRLVQVRLAVVGLEMLGDRKSVV